MLRNDFCVGFTDAEFFGNRGSKSISLMLRLPV